MISQEKLYLKHPWLIFLDSAVFTSIWRDQLQILSFIIAIVIFVRNRIWARNLHTFQNYDSLSYQIWFHNYNSVKCIIIAQIHFKTEIHFNKLTQWPPNKIWEWSVVPRVNRYKTTSPSPAKTYHSCLFHSALCVLNCIFHWESLNHRQGCFRTELIENNWANYITTFWW